MSQIKAHTNLGLWPFVKSLIALGGCGFFAFCMVMLLAALFSGSAALSTRMDEVVLFGIQGIVVINTAIHLYGQYLHWSLKYQHRVKLTNLSLFAGPLLLGIVVGGLDVVIGVLSIFER